MKSLFILALLFLFACDGGKSTGRTVETTNGFAGVVQVSNQPVALARVDLFFSDDMEGVPVATTQTDSVGRFNFTHVAPGSYRLIAYNNNQGSQYSWKLAANEGQDSIVFDLKPQRILVVNWNHMVVQAGMRVGLPGSALWKTLDSLDVTNHQVTFTGIQPGTWAEILLTSLGDNRNHSQNILRQPLVIDSTSSDTLVVVADSQLLARWSNPDYVFEDSSDGLLIAVPNLLGQPSTLTMCSWILPDTGTDMEITSLGNHMGIRTAVTDSTISIYAYYSYGEPFSWHVLGTQQAYTLGDWVHLALVVDPLNQQYILYMDGAMILSGSPLDLIAYNKNGDALTVGRHALNQNYAFSGRIAEVTWWNSALPLIRIQEEATRVPEFP